MASLSILFSFSVVIGFVIFLPIVYGLSDNLAFGKTARQTSIYRSPAKAAVDGDLASAACTKKESNPWWAVDLGQEYDVSQVDITTATGSVNLLALNNFAVGLSSVFPAEGSAVSTDSYTVCGTHTGSVDTGQVINVKCSASPHQFRYVIVQGLDMAAEKLCLAEVGVYGASMQSQSGERGSEF